MHSGRKFRLREASEEEWRQTGIEGEPALRRAGEGTFQAEECMWAYGVAVAEQHADVLPLPGFLANRL